MRTALGHNADALCYGCAELYEVLEPLVRLVEGGEWEGGSELCMLRMEGQFGRVKNDEACDGSVGLECHGGSMLWARVGELEMSS